MTEDVKKEIESNIVKSTEQTMALKVIDNITYAEAGDFLISLKALEKKIKGYFGKIKKKAYDSWKEICTLENEELDKLKPATAHLNRQMVTFNLAEGKKRKKEEDRLRREAKKKAEEEWLATAIEAEKSGNKEEAEEILEEPVFVPPPMVESFTPKIRGLAMKDNWDFEIVDIKKIPRNYFKIDEVKIRGVVKALKSSTDIPGIKVVNRKKISGVRQ